MAHADDDVPRRPADPAAAGRFVRTSAVGTVRVVELLLPVAVDSDEFDALNVALRDVLGAATGGRWVLDLSGVDYMGSSMLGLVVNARQQIKAAGGRLVLCGMSAWLVQTFHTCSLEKLFVTAATRDDAVRAVGRA